MQGFYVYLHKKKTTGEVFYVGKGSGRRANVSSHRSSFWRSVVAKHGRDVVFVITDAPEELTFEIEKALIQYYGRRDCGTGQLVNQTDGGESPAGFRHTDAAKESIRQSRLGKKLSDESRKRLSASTKGRKFSEKAKAAKAAATIRPVVRSDGIQYESIAAAVKALENQLAKPIKYSNLSSVLRGKSKTAYGYGWKYLPKTIT